MSGSTSDPSVFARVMKALMPPGKLWRHDMGYLLSQFFLGAADELVRIHGRVADLVREADPRTTVSLLPEFERERGLVAGDETIETRRGRVIGRILAQQGVRPVDFQHTLAPLLALDPADVVVLETSRDAAVAQGDPQEVYRFFVYRDPGLGGDYDLAGAQVLLDQIAHSYTKGHLIESISFLCDDPFSLCDRDLLGV